MSDATPKVKRPAKAVARYKMLAEQPTVTRGSLRSDDDGQSVSIELDLSVRSHASLSRRTLRSNIVVSTAAKTSKRVHLSTTSTDETVKASVQSRDGKRTVILREVPEGKGVGEERRRVVELWEGARCIREVHVGKRHGAFCTDGTFGGISLCPEKFADAVLYVADAKGPAKPAPSAPLAKPSDENHLAAFDFTPSLGEKSGSLLRPRVFLLRFNTSDKEQLEAGPALSQLALPDDLKDAAHGHVAFKTSDSATLTAYKQLPDGRRLGIIYCTNRPAEVLSVSLPVTSSKDTEEASKPNEPSTVAWEVKSAGVTSLSRKQWSARSARSSHDTPGSTATIWLENEEGGAHNDCAALCIQREAESSKVLVPVVDVPDAKSSFPGLYIDALPTSPWLRLNNKSDAPTHAVLTSICGSRRCVIMIDVKVGSVLNLDFASSKGATKASKLPDTASYNVLATDGGRRFLVVRSSLNELPHVGLVEIKGADGSSWTWTDVWSAHDHEQGFEQSGLGSISELQLSVITIPATRSSSDAQDLAVEAVLLRPSNADRLQKPAPCVLFPHGGPHGTTTTDFSPGVVALALAGYTICLPNYHGSLGMGQRFAHSLLGKCGTLDVQDCVDTVDYLVAQGIAARESLVVTGGSHGGFLTAHLIGQYPDMFKAAVMRNPVISSAEQAIGTDIPEWCFLEFGEQFDFNKPPSHISPEVFAKLHAASPLAHVDAIRAPVLLLLGLDDRRVPPQQSRTLYHALKGTDRKVRMLAFEGADHALDTIEAESVGWEAALTWFDEALGMKSDAPATKVRIDASQIPATPNDLHVTSKPKQFASHAASATPDKLVKKQLDSQQQVVLAGLVWTLLLPWQMLRWFVPDKASKPSTESYGSFSHLALNVQPPRTEWLNMGIWDDASRADFPAACERLARSLHERAGSMAGKKVLDVGHGAGDSLLLLLADEKEAPSLLHGVTSLAPHARRSQARVGDRAQIFCDDAVKYLQTSAKIQYDIILALDCAFHFNTRAAFFEAAFNHLEPGGVIALEDLCAAHPYPATIDGAAWTPSASLPTPSAKGGSSLSARTRLAGTCLLASVPRTNMIPVDVYASHLRQAGFVDIRIEDISARVFPGFARFLRGLGKGEEQVWRGGGFGNQAGLRAFGSLVENWAKGGDEGLVRALLVTARKPQK